MSRQKGHVAAENLFRVIVGQFLARPMHARNDVVQFERLALGLMEKLDPEAIVVEARQLCVHSQTPHTIISKLCEMGGRSALIALEFAPSISIPSDELLRRAERGSCEEAAAVARRVDVDHAVISALASRSEVEILRAIAGNRRIWLDPAILGVLTEAGRDDLWLGRILLDRSDRVLDREPLFLAASHMERAAIILEATKNAYVDPVIDGVPIAPQVQIANTLECASLAGGAESAAHILAEALNCGKGRALAILMDKSGEALALTLAALGVREEGAIRVLLRNDPRIVHDVARVRSLVGLMRFIPLRAAKHIVASMTGAKHAATAPLGRNPIYDAVRPIHPSSAISRLVSVA
jgi:uncharacterized protein (DUF2336 family)